MPWFNNFIPESLKKSVCSCLIKRYLSHYIENEITRDQLNLDIYNGRATAERISLAVEALNELGQTQNWPIEFVDGYIETIHISVPWTAIFSESSEVEICGLKITVQPKQRKENATSMFESMWNSMTTSMHLAEEFAKEEAAAKKDSNALPFEGIELFAQTIDTVVRRIKVKFVDTVFQIEHLPKGTINGVGLVIHVDSMEYYDDYSIESRYQQDTLDNLKEDSKKSYLVESFTTKNVILNGVQLSTVEFSSMDRTFSRFLVREDTRESFTKEEEFLSGNEREDSVPGHLTVEDENELRHVILCGKCLNRQEVKIRLKQSENVTGPKVAIELNLGSLISFLSPRQFHILMELVDGFSCPDLEDNSNVLHKDHGQPRPMTGKDYERVEEQLGTITNTKHLQEFNLLQAHGWSTGVLEESTESQYLSMRDGGMYDSTISGLSTSIIDSRGVSSLVGSITENTSYTTRRACNIDADPTAEISHFQVRMATFAVIVLHEDLMAHASGNEKVSVRQMQTLANDFFESIKYGPFSGLVADCFGEVHKLFEKACKLNHLRVLLAPVKLEGNETTASSAFSISGDLTASKVEVSECLYNGGFKYIPVIGFHLPQTADIPSNSRPNLAFKFKHVQKTGKRADVGKRSGSTTECSMNLDKCTLEFDLSILDRMSSMLYHSRICRPLKKDTHVRPNKSIDHMNSWFTGTAIQSVQEFRVSCPLFNFKFRFPIPDFRPATDMSKLPWWERNVRSDYLSLVLHNVVFYTRCQTGQNFSQYDIECNIIDMFYYQNENSTSFHVGRSGREEKDSSSEYSSSPLTKLSIKVYPRKVEEDRDTEVDPMTHSFHGAFENQGNPEHGPFSAKKVVHESDTPHSKQRKDNFEEQVIPGEKPELEDFVTSTSSNAHILVEVTLPVASFLLESKHMYELIYNRIINDLLLWKSQAPKSTASRMPADVQMGDLSPDQQFIVANSGVHYDSESESGEDEDDGNVFYSTHDRKMNRPKLAIHRKRNGQSKFVLSLNIVEGTISLNPPVRDSGNNVIPGQQGELLFNLTNTSVFIVSGYKGDTDLGYVCVQVNNAQLYHCDIQPTPTTNVPLKEVSAALGNHLFPTIYQTDQKNLSCLNSRCGNRDMLTVALKIQANHETHHVKVVTVSLGLCSATLKHKTAREPNSWITHIIDFFNIRDYPIPGYVPKDVLTELHLHLWNCAIDYRPLNLALRSTITIGTFSVSSHLTAFANTSTLTLYFEDCGLFLTAKAPPRNGVASTVEVDLARDYVNVVEIGLFEISIRTTDKVSGMNPHIDLRMSINMLNIRTCSDSGRALFQLLTYFINVGDLNSEAGPDKGITLSPKLAREDELLTLEHQEMTIGKSQQDHVSELLEEAIDEGPKSTTSDLSHSQTDAKMFYFPDEKDEFEELPSHNFSQVTADLGDINAYNFRIKGNKTDDEFILVGDDAIFPKDGVPEITWFSQEVKIIENHLAKPDGKKDMLAPPKDFPTPVTRYTLCDMSIVWQMYGGKDFEESCDPKKEVRFSKKQFSDIATFSNTTNASITLNQAEKIRTKGLSWVRKGGLHRDNSVLMEIHLSKVRFSHEAYPENTRQSSRQVLSIFDVEIRDRLASSQIKKFLYQYSNQSLPKQSHSNMVLIKALHARPDPKLKREECDLKISLLPIRLNIDQDSLFFMINFFNELGDDNVDKPCNDSSSHSSPTHRPPIMTVSIENQEDFELQAEQVINENLILLESKYHAEPEQENGANAVTVIDDSPIYFRHVEFSKDVLIRLDYVGKRVDMSHGPIPGLLLGLGYLKCSEIRLKRIVHRQGLLGFNKLMGYLIQEWVCDIKKNQLPTILGGLGPMKAVLQLFQGVKDLFWLPIEQYQKDGRIVRGLQRGANSFTTSTAMAALELTTRLIYFIQITAETAYDMLSPGPSIRMKRLTKRKGRKKRFHQPQDLREGLTNACILLKEGIGETAENIYHVAALEKEQKGISGAVGAIIRQIPPTILKPILIASEATTNVLGGMQSQLVPDTRKEANEKWRSDS